MPSVFGLVLPSREQVTQGASWVRCEVLFPSDWAGTRVAWVDFAAQNASTEHADDLWACLDADPAKFSQPLVSCRKPHQYEETGRLAFIPQADSYPSPQQLRQAATQCNDLTPEQKSRATDTTVSWPPKEGFTPGDVIGICLLYQQDGSMLPPRP